MTDANTDADAAGAFIGWHKPVDVGSSSWICRCAGPTRAEVLSQLAELVSKLGESGDVLVLPRGEVPATNARGSFTVAVAELQAARESAITSRGLITAGLRRKAKKRIARSHRRRAATDAK